MYVSTYIDYWMINQTLNHFDLSTSLRDQN